MENGNRTNSASTFDVTRVKVYPLGSSSVFYAYDLIKRKQVFIIYSNNSRRDIRQRLRVPGEYSDCCIYIQWNLVRKDSLSIILLINIGLASGS